MKRKVERMKRLVTVFGISLVLALVSACKFEAEVKDSRGDDEKGPYNALQTTAKAYCKKLIKVRPQSSPKDKGSALKLVSGDQVVEGDSKRKAQADLSQDEILLEVSYELSEKADGTRDIRCQISDGGRAYQGDNFVSANRAWNAKNTCDIVYDLDNPTYGGFTFEYQTDWAWINYYDEDGGYSFNIKFRNSECVEL